MMIILKVMIFGRRVRDRLLIFDTTVSSPGYLELRCAHRESYTKVYAISAITRVIYFRID